MIMYHRKWEQTESLQINYDSIPTKKVSVIIPVRNESQNILLLLEDLLAQEYPKDLLEIIIVDDHSEDNTVELVQSINSPQVKLLELQKILHTDDIQSAYKKKAIEIGVQNSNGELIMTTDGDCRIHSKWVASMVNIQKQTQAKLLTGAVIMEDTNNSFKKFQALDFLGMMGITAAMLKMKIYNMANGANLLYEKQAFEKVGGFQGIDHIASGDDMLLMYKIAQEYQGAVAYAKHTDAVVYTKTAPTVEEFLQQRFRWTAKSKDYQDPRMTWILGLVFLFTLTLLVNILLTPFSWVFLAIAIPQLVVKCVVDYKLLHAISYYYNRGHLISSFITSQILHILYIVIVGSLGNILKFEWKGRKQTK